MADTAPLTIWTIAEGLHRLVRGYVDDQPEAERAQLKGSVDVALRVASNDWTWRLGCDERITVLVGCSRRGDADWATRNLLRYVTYAEERECVSPAGRRSRRYRATLPGDVAPFRWDGPYSDFYTLAIEWPSDEQQRLRRSYEERLPALTALLAAVYAEVDEVLRGVAGVVRVTFATKSAEQFMADLECGEYTRPLAEVEDQVAGCVVVPSSEALGEVVKRLRDSYSLVGHDRLVEPLTARGGGYVAERLVCAIPPQLVPSGWSDAKDRPAAFEVQVRTLFVGTEPSAH